MACLLLMPCLPGFRDHVSDPGRPNRPGSSIPLDVDRTRFRRVSRALARDDHWYTLSAFCSRFLRFQMIANMQKKKIPQLPLYPEERKCRRPTTEQVLRLKRGTERRVMQPGAAGEASRLGSDKDGRKYTIQVSATDGAGNVGLPSAPVTVTAHDQSKK